MAKEEIMAQIQAIAARSLEVRALLICCAQDPVKMVEVLQPLLDHADIKGGQIPQLYSDLALAEMRRRAASAPGECIAE